MKKFILNVFLFVFGLTIANYLIFQIVYTNYLKGYGIVYDHYQTYILGDSHAMHLGVWLQKKWVYNFSDGGDSYEDMLRKIEYLVEHTSVKRIVIEADDHLISKHRENANNLDRSVIFASSSDFNNYYNYFINKYVKRYIPLLNPKSRSFFKMYFQSKLNTPITNTISMEWQDNAYKAELAEKRAREQFSDSESSILLSNDLKKIITVCKKNNIQLIAIKFPLSGDYLNSIKNVTYHTDSIFYKANIPLYDYSKLFENDDSFFTNQDHLNQKGGKSFADILSQKLCK